jgi:succinyl-CoA synthetase beta subunit
MKLLEYEAKEIFARSGIPTPQGGVVRVPEEVEKWLNLPGDRVVLKAQVEVGGRGKAGGVVITEKSEAVVKARDLFSKTIKGIAIREVLVEEFLPIQKEYYLAITVDRSSKGALLLFAESGGVDIEDLAERDPRAVRRTLLSPLVPEVPQFMLRYLTGKAPKEVGQVIQALYRVFREKDAILAEINPLASTARGMVAADAKLIVDDNALKRQGIEVNRDLSMRERVAEENGFSYVDLVGTIGVIGNGAGLTMATLDLIEYYKGSAANFLDVGGGAGEERVKLAVQLVSENPSVNVIVVNLLGGITRCDEVARGIISAGVSQRVIVRLAGTNEEEGRRLLAERGYEMLGSMDEVVRAALEVKG